MVSKLAGKGEIPYSPLLLSFPFKGAEDKLRKLEAAEFISVTSVNGRPSLIRPGKPVRTERSSSRRRGLTMLARARRCTTPFSVAS